MSVSLIDIFFLLIHSFLVNKPAEYKSPTPNRSSSRQNVFYNNKCSSEDLKLHNLAPEKNTTDRLSKSLDCDLFKMSTNELVAHVEGLRNTVKRLQEAECSFITDAEN